MIERQIDYSVAAAEKLQKERLKSIEVKKEAVADFDEYLEVRSRYHLPPAADRLHRFSITSPQLVSGVILFC